MTHNVCEAYHFRGRPHQTLLRIRWRRSPKEIGIPRWLRVEASFIIESSLEDRAACLPLPRLHGEPRTPLSLSYTHSPSPSLFLSLLLLTAITERPSYTNTTEQPQALILSQGFMTQIPVGHIYSFWTFTNLSFLVQGEGKVTILQTLHFKTCGVFTTPGYDDN